MEPLLLASAVLDCAAVAAIAWFVRRAGHDHDAVLALHWRTLDRLRAELVGLVHAAEERGRALTAALDAREQRAHLGVDPAEARLLRDLERAASGGPPRG